MAHGFDVVIYEKEDKVGMYYTTPCCAQPLCQYLRTTGGIWSSVNKTSGLQLNSILYRFHPAVFWSKFFPHRDEILGGMFCSTFSSLTPL